MSAADYIREWFETAMRGIRECSEVLSGLDDAKRWGQHFSDSCEDRRGVSVVVPVLWGRF